MPTPELKEIPAQQLQDEVIAALLLHDLIKNGKGLDPGGRPLESGVTGTHGVTLADKIIFSHIFLDNEDTLHRILIGITAHMGIWTTDKTRQPDKLIDPTERAFANLIHLADYCASRKVDDAYLELGGTL